MRTDAERYAILKESLETILRLGADKRNGTALISSGINIKHGEPTYMYFKLSNGAVAASNLAFQSGIMRALESFSRISGDGRYSAAVDRIYRWYAKNGLSNQYLGYWGGHSCINMLTGKPENARIPSVLELKDAFVYMKPFYRINPELGENIDRAVFCGAIADWSNLAFNRHIPHDKPIDYSHWFDYKNFDDSALGHTMNKHLLSFNTAGNDIALHMFGMYESSGDERALVWGMRLLNSYYAGRDKKTGLIPTLNATPWGFGIVKYEDYYGPKWYMMDEVAGGGSRSAWSSVFGDRFYNQFAENLVEQGFFTKEVLETDLLTEKNYIGNPWDIPDSALLFLNLSKRLGKDGDYIADIEIKRLAGYIKYAWVKNTPYFKQIMLDGTDLTGFEPNCNGYFGKFYNSGYAFEKNEIRSNFFLALCVACETAKRHGDKYIEENKRFFELLQYLSREYYKIGTMGSFEPGDEGCCLTSETDLSDPGLVISFSILYNSTRNKEFLRAAKIIADNMIDKHYRFGLFNGYGKDKSALFGMSDKSAETGVNGNELGNVHVGGANSIFYTALIYLESVVSGKYNEVEEYFPFNAFYDADFLDSDGEYKPVWDNMIWNMNNKDYEEMLKKGEGLYE